MYYHSYYYYTDDTSMYGPLEQDKICMLGSWPMNYSGDRFHFGTFHDGIVGPLWFSVYCCSQHIIIG